MIVIAGIVTYTSTANKPAGENDPTTALITVAAIVLFFGWTIFNLFRKQKKALLDYCVTITDEEISLQQQKNHKITISFMEIKEIIKTEQSIASQDKANVVVFAHSYHFHYLYNHNEINGIKKTGHAQCAWPGVGC